MQSTVRPLLYIDLSNGGPGSVLTYVTGSRGGIGQWKSISVAPLLDPSSANTVNTLVESYNSLVWGLHQTGLVVTEPRVWFGAAGADGVQLSLTGAPLAAAYAPYFGAGGAYSYISMSEALAALNGMLGNISGAQFRYENSRVSLIIKSGTSIQFDEKPAAYGSTRRMMNRLFLRDISGYIGVPLTGPLLIQGQPITVPTYGVFPEPAPAPNTIRFINQTNTSFDVAWDASPTPGVAYYVRIEGLGLDKLFLTPLTSLVLDRSKGIIPNITYTATIYTTTPYEVSTTGNPSASNSIIIVFPSFTLTVPSLYYKNIDVFWSPVADAYRYSMSIQLNSETPQVVSADTPRYVGFTNKQPGIYNITAFLVNADGYQGQTTTATVELFDIPQPNISLSGTTANSVTLTHTLLTPPERQGLINNIEITYTENGNTVTVIRPYSNTTITINSLTPFTDYVFELRYVLTDNINKGDPSQVAAITSLPPLSLTLGTVTATRITVTWPVRTPNYVVTFTAPTPSFDVDAALGTYTFKLLQPTTNYTITAYLKKSGVQGQSESINATTPVLPAKFGPINDGKPYGSVFDAVVLNLNPGNLGSQFGVTIPDDSIYTTYKFNKIEFPLMFTNSGASVGTMINRGIASAFVKIYIYNDSSRSQIITESNTVEIYPRPGLDQNTPYLFTFPIVVTLAKDMCIIPTILTTGGETRISYYTYSNGDPLLGLVDRPGDTTLISTNFIMLFNFLWQ